MKTGKRIFAACVLGLGLALLGCNDGGDDGLGPAPTTAELIGKWYLREVAAKGAIDVDFQGIFDTTIKVDTVEAFTGTRYYAEFKADNTYETYSPDDDYMPDFDFDFDLEKKSAADGVLETGTWALSGSTLTMTAEPSEDFPEGYVLAQTVALNGGTLTMQAVVDTSNSGEGFSFSTNLRTTAKLVK